MLPEGQSEGVCLEVLVKRDGQPYLRIALDRSPAVVGRDEHAALCLPSKKVSRHHARLEFDQHGIRIIDSGSRNGFRVDGEPCEQAVLTPKNTVRLCDFEFRVRLTAAPRMDPGAPQYFENNDPPATTAAKESPALVPPPARDRIPPAPTQALESELAEGWAEIEQDGDEDTNVRRIPQRRGEKIVPEGLYVERSVMNQLAFSPSRADVALAVGEDLDEDDADEYIRPDVEPLLKVLHRETEHLVPDPRTDSIAVEVIFAIGASIEETALLRAGERFWWGGKPSRLREATLVPNENRFPLVTHVRDGRFRVDVPQQSGWKLFRRGQGAAPAHRSGVLMGIETDRHEQIEVAYGPFTFYIRCVSVPDPVHTPLKVDRPSRHALFALMASSVIHVAAMLVPVDPLPSLSDQSVDTDRFVDLIAADPTFEFPDPEILPPVAPPEPRRSMDVLLEPIPERRSKTPPARAPPQDRDSPEPASASAGSDARAAKAPLDNNDTARRSDGPASVTKNEAPRRGELSIDDFKVVDMIEHLPQVKIDPARGPKARSGAGLLRGDGSGRVSLVDKSGQGMDLTPSGRLAKSEVRQVVNKNSRDIGRCQARAIKERPDLNGKLVLQWRVQSSGSASQVRVVYDDLGSAEFTNCAKAAVLSWVFPEPKNGTATVSYPFKIRNLNL